MLWHDGYPQELLADAAESGAEDAVVVMRDQKQWVVYRTVAGHREQRGRYSNAEAAYGKALEWIYEICRVEGR